MKFILLLLVAATVSSQAASFLDSLSAEWDNFKITHDKKYNSEAEEKFRLKIYKENKLLIIKHNVQYEIGLVSFKLGLNKYGDMLHHEFISTLNGFNKSRGLSTVSVKKPIGATFIIPAHVEIPNDVDWTTEGAVTAVKDQGACGSCWAFSAIGALEGQKFRKDGILIPLSEQNLIDCSDKYGNHGCGGGLMNNAFTYIKDNGGIDTEEGYPYEGRKKKCRYDPKSSGATDVGFTDIPSGDEEKLKAAVATVGPVSVAIDASHPSFQFYSEGVYYERNCSSQDLDHGVLAVGYGTSEDGDDYWLVKNSWGTSWGEAGYIKMARNKNNNCGIATTASYPLV